MEIGVSFIICAELIHGVENIVVRNSSNTPVIIKYSFGV